MTLSKKEIVRHIDRYFCFGLDGLPAAERIGSADPERVRNLCGFLAGSPVARVLTEADPVHDYVPAWNSRYPDSRYAPHRYLIRISKDVKVEAFGDGSEDEIVDPSALQLIQSIPDSRKGSFYGTMFMGTRRELSEIVSDHRTVLHDIWHRGMERNPEQFFDEFWGQISSWEEHPGR